MEEQEPQEEQQRDLLDRLMLHGRHITNHHTTKSNTT